MVTKDTLHDSIWVKIFNFRFYFMEQVLFTMFIDIFNRDSKANMTDMAFIFNRANSVIRVFSQYSPYFSWREVELIITMSTANQNRMFLSKEAGKIHWQSPYAC